MTLATVVEMPQHLEAVTHDPFIDDEAADRAPSDTEAPGTAAPIRRRIVD